ncbi:DNA sulfur modification protein DndD [Enterobacter hormaechei]|uniref:DNA sulfur modification protein DndD n=1 Tax=Enterobacter hormaechei TaxID=158836 RepID=UPI003F4292C5
MILEELKLNNFGIYKGIHEISLDSPDPLKPVILIGALNGAGKTTFLDALQLALYGKFAKCSNRGRLSYSAYLEKNINHFAEQKKASVTIRFRHNDNTFKPHVYEIERSWEKIDKKDCKEKVTVLYNGVHDLLLSENWDEIVNEFIPQSISELFFFNGEKIENIADPKRSAEFLKTGIEALLGLENLSQLSNNLKVIKRRKQEKLLNKEDNYELLTLKNNLEQLIANRDKLHEELNTKNIELESVNEELSLLEYELTSSGADKLSLRKDIEKKIFDLNQQRFEIEHSQLRLAASVLPLKLVRNLINKCNVQLKAEIKFNQYKNAEKIIIEHQNTLMEAILAVITDSKIKRDICHIFDKKNVSSTVDENFHCYLNTPEINFDFIVEKLKVEEKEFKEYIDKKANILEELAFCHQKMATIPNLDDVKHLIEKNALLNEKKNTITNQKNILNDEINILNGKLDTLTRKYESLLHKSNSETFEHERQHEIINHIDSLQTIVNEFNAQMVQENIKRLEGRIKSKFDQLKRKDSLIERLTIDPNDFNITLYTHDYQILSADRLSAGERQLFAISILWGLADCSGKELPTIIDTPMGRLDGMHRTRLIKNYFPRAASQVILLSTDEEIYGKYYDDLAPALAQEYSIIYNEENNSSAFHKGYLKVKK